MATSSSSALTLDQMESAEQTQQIIEKVLQRTKLSKVSTTHLRIAFCDA